MDHRVAEWGYIPPYHVAAGGAAHGDSKPNWFEPVIFLHTEKVLKLTYSKVETQICGGNTPDPHFRGGREGEGGERGGRDRKSVG